MQITEELKAKAEQAFEKQLREIVDWIANSCWPRHLELKLREVNEIIVAGRQLEVANAETLTPEEIKQLAADFAPLRTLEMSAEVCARLIELLVSKGIDKSFFKPEPTTVES